MTDSRSTQVWIGYDGAAGLGKSPWETPFGEVIEGMSNVDDIYGGYGDKPDQGKLHSLGKNYVEENFPKLDFINRCFVVNKAADSKQQQVIEDVVGGSDSASEMT
jgi:cyclophilin family peptidyl-prolyl cis-trans isomerase